MSRCQLLLKMSSRGAVGRSVGRSVSRRRSGICSDRMGSLSERITVLDGHYVVKRGFGHHRREVGDIPPLRNTKRKNIHRCDSCLSEAAPQIILEVAKKARKFLIHSWGRWYSATQCPLSSIPNVPWRQNLTIVCFPFIDMGGGVVRSEWCPI